MAAMRLFDHYDWAAVVGVVVMTLLGALATGAWVLSFAFGALVGNVSAYMLRRRASVPDHSLLGWMRARR
jgi:hypothetical protein